VPFSPVFTHSIDWNLWVWKIIGSFISPRILHLLFSQPPLEFQVAEVSPNQEQATYLFDVRANQDGTEAKSSNGKLEWRTGCALQKILFTETHPFLD
jgi:hypothetical protein